ncbi:MAG: amidohydrolase family protein [Dehalococcoidia bacterium]
MPALLFNDAVLLDGTGAEPRGRSSALVEDGRIARIDASGAIDAPVGARVIDCGGRTLMPGLTDAHVHFGLTDDGTRTPESHVSYVLKVVENIRIALDEGFTTVRDAGGLDPAYALAVEQGQIPGPRILPSGSFLSQTGGHGDQRFRFDDEAPPSIPGLVAHSEICDSPDDVRRAARKQIRRGATQVKLMASGGIMSPNDPLESLQFSVEEMAAAVAEARSFGTYVMAHTHTSGAMNRALDAGVRSLEHASMLDQATARRIAEQDAYIVPTLVIFEILSRSDRIPEFSRSKLELVRREAAASVRVALDAGVRIASGSDLLGPSQRRRGNEIVEKAKHMGAMAAIVSATKTNAELFRMADRIGTVEAGREADLIVVDGDVGGDVGALVDARNVVLVVKSGEIVKDAL